jgi:hypothetical protein
MPRDFPLLDIPDLLFKAHSPAPSVNTAHQCRECKTVYFEEQACDWCPGQIAKAAVVASEHHFLN